jgi:hypothetical protein
MAEGQGLAEGPVYFSFARFPGVLMLARRAVIPFTAFMSLKMKRTVVFAIAMIFVGIFIFTLGPTLGFDKSPKILDNLVLADSSRLVLVLIRDDPGAEPYDIYLYRIYRDQKAEGGMIWFKESYWWFPKMEFMTNGLVDIRVMGSSVFKYDPESNASRWTDGSHGAGGIGAIITADPFVDRLRREFKP